MISKVGIFALMSVAFGFVSPCNQAAALDADHVESAIATEQ
jgi:hypothetical protein